MGSGYAGSGSTFSLRYDAKNKFSNFVNKTRYEDPLAKGDLDLARNKDIPGNIEP